VRLDGPVLGEGRVVVRAEPDDCDDDVRVPALRFEGLGELASPSCAMVGSPSVMIAESTHKGRAGRLIGERAAVAAEGAALRTPRVPDAGLDQCPVCGGYGLDALAADDKLMERGALSKVVPYGPRRAHWDCAEFVPYKPTQAELRTLQSSRLAADHWVRHHGGPSAGVFGCPVCGKEADAQRAGRGSAPACSFTARIQDLPAKLRWAHACVCDDCMAVVVQPPTRSAVKAARPSWMSASEAQVEARVLAHIEEARLAPCRAPKAMLTAWREQQSARIVEEIRRLRP
jgi:Zn-finger nucleic acid-binding protein